MEEKILQAILELKQDVQDVKQDIQDLKAQNTKIQLTLENELIFGIKAVADGHLDLMRSASWHGSQIAKLITDMEQVKVKQTELSYNLRNLEQKVG